MAKKDFIYESAVILGAGPVGLWAAKEMLENNFAKNVIILEKRFKFDSKLDSWAEREMVVQFHRSILSIPKNEVPLTICPHGVTKDINEQNRNKYTDLDHMSIKNIQVILKNHLLNNYPERFLLLEMQRMILQGKTPIVDIGVGWNDTKLFHKNFNPEFIVDATGYHSAFMNKMLGIKFEGSSEYGHALKITWPEHEINTTGKKSEFHDCHANSPFFSNGYSSLAEFSAPIIEAIPFFNDCGYDFPASVNDIPFLEDDITPFSVKLPSFIRKILYYRDNHEIYDKAVALFKEIRKGKLHGINGFDFILRLKEFRWNEADKLALIIRQTVNKKISDKEVFINLSDDEINLKKVRIVFVPSREERWLSTNEKNITVGFKLINNFGDNFELSCKVKACAVGDSLASTDFRHGLGINRGIHTATRIFKDRINPEQVRFELIRNGYFKLNDVTDQEIFNRAISCRDWLLKLQHAHINHF